MKIDDLKKLTMKQIKLEQKVLTRNDIVAKEVRDLFNSKSIAVFNMVSSPGSGKTSLLEATLEELSNDLSIAVIEGDVQTSKDAERIEKTGVPVHQINTGGACHLEALMIRDALENFDLDSTDLMVIENVGNLVCPSAFDLGEGARVALISVAEGDDKPLKYPAMFHTSDVLVINKMDLLPYTDFSVQQVIQNARSLKPDIYIIKTSCRTGDGLEDWMDWVRDFVSDSKSV